MTLSEIKTIKKQLGYSNKKLAEEAGLPLGTVQKVLCGQSENPRHKTLLALSDALKRGLEEMPSADSTSYSADMFRPGNSALEVHESSTAFAGGSACTAADELAEDAVSGNWRRQGTYTVQDYEAIPDDIRVELIDGVIYDKSAPSIAHQLILSEVNYAMLAYRKERGIRSCMPVMAPYDVQLDMDDFTIVQPDLLVVCKKKGLDLKKRLYGAPEFVMEILSDSTRKKDMGIKYHKYASAGVREYWIVDPDSERVLAYDLEGMTFPKIYTFQDKVPLLISGGELVIDFSVIKEELDAFIGQYAPAKKAAGISARSLF